MGMEKRGSNYVGGFLQMFDWNAKSRKKLMFSSKPDLPGTKISFFKISLAKRTLA